MADFVWQTANLAGFISGCYTDDLDLIREGLNDVVIEPQRRQLIPGFSAVRAAAISAGALGARSRSWAHHVRWALRDHAPTRA
jgi:homoserine kinase